MSKTFYLITHDQLATAIVACAKTYGVPFTPDEDEEGCLVEDICAELLRGESVPVVEIPDSAAGALVTYFRSFKPVDMENPK